MTSQSDIAAADPVAAPEAPGRRGFSLTHDTFLLDVDGTIIDIAPSPEEVEVPDSLKQTLARLQQECSGAVALVSGRELASLDRLFAPLALAVIGCHGAQWRADPQSAIEERAQLLSSELKRCFLSAITDQAQIRVEDKGYTLAFHYRRAPDRGAELEAQLRHCIAPFSTELRLLRGKSVIEVKPRSFDKGEAIRALMRRQPFAGRRPVFLGDDTTDEDAFSAVRRLGGVGISVGRHMPDAQLMLATPQAARRWLARLAGKASTARRRA